MRAAHGAAYMMHTGCAGSCHVGLGSLEALMLWESRSPACVVLFLGSYAASTHTHSSAVGLSWGCGGAGAL